jgi:exoribonuclease R
MFPKELAEGIMSILNTSPKNYSLTFSAQISKLGEILEYRITPSIIRNIVKMDYHQVDAILGNSSHSLTSFLLFSHKNADFSNHQKDIQQIHEIAVARKSHRKRMGAFTAHLPKPELKIKADGSITFKLEEEAPSMILVSEMMVLAGNFPSPGKKLI